MSAGIYGDEGKIRFIGMSGTLPNIEDQIAMGVFDSFQIPYSAVEREYEEIITRAAASGAGVVIRGGVAKGIPAAPRPKLAGLLGSVAKCSPVAVKAKVVRLVPERYRGESAAGKAASTKPTWTNSWATCPRWSFCSASPSAIRT